MILRPHHLLCTQAYKGKGYSDDFIKNMDEKVNLLRTNKNIKVLIDSNLDDICLCCPGNNGTSCDSMNKVQTMDEKVCKYFSIENKSYNYAELVKKIKSKINREIFRDICGQCEWYKYDICAELILP